MSERSEIYPTPERGNHDPVERIPTSERIADSNGGIADPFRVVSGLERLERRGAITREQRLAGDTFAAMFYFAHLDPLKAADVSRPFVSGKAIGNHTAPEAARRYIREQMLRLGSGSPHASIAWHVLGVQCPIRLWRLIQAQNNRQISVYKAAKILIETLTILAEKNPLDRI